MSGRGDGGYRGSDDIERDRTEALAALARMDAPAEREAKRGAALIAAERERQMLSEGWTPEHDAEHINGELRDAAIAYLMATDDHADELTGRDIWPWDESWWKPKDALSNLVRAGALIAAEIDRLNAMQSEVTADA